MFWFSRKRFSGSQRVLIAVSMYEMIRPGARPQPYDRHVGRYGARLARQLIAAADVAPGQRVLDVGCGLGALTIELARALGEEGVAAIDPSEEAVETCGARPGFNG